MSTTTTIPVSGSSVSGGGVSGGASNLSTSSGTISMSNHHHHIPHQGGGGVGSSSSYHHQTNHENNGIQQPNQTTIEHHHVHYNNHNHNNNNNNIHNNHSDLIEIKSKFEAEFRRFSLQRSEITNLEDFIKLIEHFHKLFSIPFCLFYTDPIHGDLLPISNDTNFALAIASAKPLLRLIVQRKGESIDFLNSSANFGGKKKNFFGTILPTSSSDRGKVRLNISAPEDFRQVSSIIDVDIVPETCRRVRLVKHGSDKPLGFYIRDGTSVRVTSHGVEKVPGIFISRLVPGGLAESTGLLAVNDEVLEVNGIEVNGKSLDQVTDMMVANSSNLIITIRPANQGRNGTIGGHSTLSSSFSSNTISSSSTSPSYLHAQNQQQAQYAATTNSLERSGHRAKVSGFHSSSLSSNSASFYNSHPSRTATTIEPNTMTVPYYSATSSLHHNPHHHHHHHHHNHHHPQQQPLPPQQQQQQQHTQVVHNANSASYYSNPGVSVHESGTASHNTMQAVHLPPPLPLTSPPQGDIIDVDLIHHNIDDDDEDDDEDEIRDHFTVTLSLNEPTAAATATTTNNSNLSSTLSIGQSQHQSHNNTNNNHYNSFAHLQSSSSSSSSPLPGSTFLVNSSGSAITTNTTNNQVIRTASNNSTNSQSSVTLIRGPVGGSYRAKKSGNTNVL